MNRSTLLSLLIAMCFSAASGAAELLLLNKADATLWFIDPSTGRSGASVVTGDGPHEIELSSDGKLAFVGNYGTQTPGSSLSVIDIAARKELARVDLGELKRPHGLSFVDGRLYFTSEASKRVARFNPQTRRVDWQFETGQDVTHMVLATRDGAKLFTTNIGSNTVSIIERVANNDWKQTLVAVGAGPEALDLAPNGHELWVGHSRDGGISVIDVTGKKVAQTFNANTKRSNRLKFTPDGKTVLVSDLSGGELVVIDANTRSEKARIKVGRVATGILIRPDGQVAYVACSGENYIAVVDLKTLTVVKTIPTGASPDGMAWVN